MGRRSMALAEDPREERKPSFWLEVYWFLLICVGGGILAILVLAPRLARHRSSLDLETEIRGTLSRLTHLERQYEAALQALENDSFYREEVIRHVLKVKKRNEDFLQMAGAISDNR